MHTRTRTACLLAMSFALIACSGGDSPERLASELQVTLDRGDVDGLLQLVDVTGAPAMLQGMVMDLADECSSEYRCTVSVAERDAEYEAQMSEGLAREGVELSHPIAGLISIVGVSRDAEEGQSSSMNMRMPYAQTGDRYRIVSGRYSAARIAEMKATSAEAQAAQILEHGIMDMQTGEPDPEWVHRAEKLPPGGGEIGVVWLGRERAIAAAVRANDPDAAYEAAPEHARWRFSKTDFNGKEIPMERRKLRLRIHSVRMLHDVEILSGYVEDDVAVLVIEARNGADATVRGAQILRRIGDDWLAAGSDLIEIPAGA